MSDSKLDIEIRKLIEPDFNLIDGFIETQIRTIPRDFFFPPSSTIIKMALKKDTGISHGAFDNEKLIGIRLTYRPGLDIENHGYDLNYDNKQLNQVAQFHGTLILDNKRYKGIGNRLVSENVSDIFNGFSNIILATVHPDNDSSIRMLEKNGFDRKVRTFKYSNLPRLIFEKRK